MKTILLFICIFAVSTASHAETFNHTGQFFTNLPAPWVAVPDASVRKRVREVAAIGSINVKEDDVFAYQPQPSDRVWLTTFPYCIGSVYHNGGNDSEWLQLASQDKPDLDAKIAAIVARQISSKGVGKQAQPVYDSAKHILWDAMVLPINSESQPDDTRVVGLLVSMMTSDGYMVFRFYSTLSDYAESIGDFRQIVESIRLKYGVESPAMITGSEPLNMLLRWCDRSWIPTGIIFAVMIVGALKVAFRSRGKN